MRRGSGILVLGVVTAVVVVAAVAVHRPPPGGGEDVRGPLYPDLMERVNEAAEVVVANSEGERFGAVLEDGTWVVPQASGYPASERNVRQLIIGLAELTRFEAKTSKPERYAELGLTDPEQEGSRAVRYVVKDRAGNDMVNLIVGDREEGKTGFGTEELFARKDGEAQSWLVEGKLPRVEDEVDILDRGLIDLAPDRARRVEVRHADGQTVLVTREDPEQEIYTLHDVPADKKIKYQWSVKDIGRAFEALQLDDVRPASELDFSAPKWVAELTTFDGLVVTMEAIEIEERTYATLTARFDAAASAGDDAAKEAVRTEAERLDGKWNGWAYEIYHYRADNIGRTMAELTEPLVAEEGEGAS